MKKLSISVEVLNELLSSSTRRKYLVTKGDGHKGVPEDYDGYQGEYNETFEYYKHPQLPESLFLQITYRTDSYGDNNYIYEMKFVEGKEKTITVYEPII